MNYLSISYEKAFVRSNLPVRFNMIEGPAGPVFIVQDGSHRVATSKRAELPKVMGLVNEVTISSDQTTRDSLQAQQWQKFIDRGLIAGTVMQQVTCLNLNLKIRLSPGRLPETDLFLR